MAIIFEMQVDFDNNRTACHTFCEYMADRLTPVTINGKTISFHPPGGTFVTIPAHAWTNVSLCPRDVGHGLSCDIGGFIALNDDEMFELSTWMYQLLKDAPGYTCALVGWELGNINSIIDSYRLNPVYTPDGLVLHKEKYKNFISDKWEEFDQNHVWCPLESAFGNVFADDDE